MDISKHTIEYTQIDKFPWKVGDKVIIKWPGFEPEKAEIVKLCVSRQWGKDVVSSVLVKTEKHEKPFGCNHSLFEKI